MNHENCTAATDAFGRRLPEAGGITPRAGRQDRHVGLFYFLWLGQHGTEGPFDNTRILREAPEAVRDPDHPLWGPEQSFHFWGEPLYGYYLSDDAWVLRKHVQLLTSAGVDFLVFDTTNAATYRTVYEALLAVLEEYRAQGWDVPRVAFYTNTKSGETVGRIYDDLYREGRYRELWFEWDGKPLIIGDPDECAEEHRAFFTFRRSQWPFEDAKTNGFPWIEFCRPQRVYRNERGEKEIVSVSVAQHPSIAMSDSPFYGYGDNWGRSFHAGEPDAGPDASLRGFNIEEQWAFALREDPKIVFVTGWNEWIAMRLPGAAADRPVRFVDQATLEFSRDIEMMKGGYGDSYYLQLIAWIRRFKGLPPQPRPSGQTTIDLAGPFRKWDAVSPEYRDFAGDTAHRDHAGYGRLSYTNDSGRNDLIAMKVARDADYVYFYARTARPLTPSDVPGWMMLFIRTRESEGSGTGEHWDGYQYVVNRTVRGENATVLERSLGGWSWEAVADVPYRAEGGELQLRVPRKLLGLADGPLRLGFKWADNAAMDGDPMDFYASGDTAPEGRLYFIYEAKE
ncbi:hypothetical protein [Paenibacillus arenilitoris]|uniref:Uncharacterized protein n=1 Tax=Paenibacillus arenilitoris TaxID=2772299 RepID=A0A927H3D5_9BACL|nr:hypothetical protein [Paenibacillus arenilitoris]MBD2867211.1 hypothetical protein [Paenibacillus arenilitoris]